MLGSSYIPSLPLLQGVGPPNLEATRCQSYETSEKEFGLLNLVLCLGFRVQGLGLRV